MTDRPILFSGPMVRAILREIEQPGTGKTQTRRVLDAACDEPPAFVEDGVITAFDENDKPYRWPRTAAVGDRLYVREAWRTGAAFDKVSPRDLPQTVHVAYEADDDRARLTGRFRQGMHMPRWASRLTLVVTDVRVQRLQDISEEDAIAEGVEPLHQGYFPYGISTFMTTFVDGREVPAQCCRTARDSFRCLWDSLNAERGFGWGANPWVVAYTFQTHRCNIDEVPA